VGIGETADRAANCGQDVRFKANCRVRKRGGITRRKKVSVRWEGVEGNVRWGTGKRNMLGKVSRICSVKTHDARSERRFVKLR